MSLMTPEQQRDYARDAFKAAADSEAEHGCTAGYSPLNIFGSHLKPDLYAEVIAEIHNSPFKTVMAITGGGTEAIGELLKRGEGSKTLIEAVVPYDQKAFESFVKGKPDKCCSGDAARILAMAAFQRAYELTGTFEKMIGVGATCSLTKDNEREGRKHHIYIATQTTFSTTTHEYEIKNNTSRLEQEKFAAELIIDAIAMQTGTKRIFHEKQLEVETKTDHAYLPYQLDALLLVPGMNMAILPLKEESPRYPLGVSDGLPTHFVFSGSFNPLHKQHIKMIETVRKLTGHDVDLEMCLRNVDKPFMNFHEVQKRIKQILDTKCEFIDQLIFTTKATFAEKAMLMPNTNFIVGFDTLTRITNFKYYSSPEAMYSAFKIIKSQNCRFLAFHRINDGKVSTMRDFDMLPETLQSLTTLISDDDFIPIDWSSTQERLKNEN